MKFRNIGGGYNLQTRQSDDTYESEDGKIKFTVISDLIGHTYLPEEYEIKNFSEIKILEGNEIRQAIKNPTNENSNNTLDR